MRSETNSSPAISRLERPAAASSASPALGRGSARRGCRADAPPAARSPERARRTHSSAPSSPKSRSADSSEARAAAAHFAVGLGGAEREGSVRASAKGFSIPRWSSTGDLGADRRVDLDPPRPGAAPGTAPAAACSQGGRSAARSSSIELASLIDPAQRQQRLDRLGVDGERRASSATCRAGAIRDDGLECRPTLGRAGRRTARGTRAPSGSGPPRSDARRARRSPAPRPASARAAFRRAEMRLRERLGEQQHRALRALVGLIGGGRGRGRRAEGLPEAAGP